MNGSSLLKTTSKALPADRVRVALEALLLMGAGALAVVLHQAFRWPLGLPGHHGIEWMALLLIGRGFSRLGPAGSLVSVGAAVTSALPLWGYSDPFIWIIYMLPGPIADLAFRYLPRYADKIWFFMLIGGVAHITKPIFRLGITIISGWSFGSFRYGVVYPVTSHLMYGLIGGLLGAIIVLGIRSISTKSKQS